MTWKKRRDAIHKVFLSSNVDFESGTINGEEKRLFRFDHLVSSLSSLVLSNLNGSNGFTD